MVPVHSFEMICWFGESAASMEQKREEKKKMATDMTKGSIIPQITRFTIPLEYKEGVSLRSRWCWGICFSLLTTRRTL